MLLWLNDFLSYHLHSFRVFNYLIFRSIVSAVTALVIALTFCPYLIKKLKKLQIGQVVRDDGPQAHLKKSGTPTMGGILIILVITITTLLWGDLSNRFIWIVLLVTITFGLIGWVDDYRKIIRKNSKGLSARSKYVFQSLIGLATAIYLYVTTTTPTETQLIIPFLKNVAPNLGLLYIFLAYFVIVGSSNAVNLTDGLDGLALMLTMVIAGALGIFAYFSGNYLFTKHLAIPYISGVSEIVIFCSILVGGGMGFLWYNAYPAQVFMGDVGSLGLGAALGVIAVMVCQEIVYFFMAGVFVLETLSVIIQVGYFKLSGGKRFFRMAPLHHHFELKGWSEPKVIIWFCIITFILVLFGTASLKLR